MEQAGRLIACHSAVTSLIFEAAVTLQRRWNRVSRDIIFAIYSLKRCGIYDALCNSDPLVSFSLRISDVETQALTGTRRRV